MRTPEEDQEVTRLLQRLNQVVGDLWRLGVDARPSVEGIIEGAVTDGVERGSGTFMAAHKVGA